MKKLWIFLWVLGIMGIAHARQVSCVGDSITYGSGIADRNTDSYPAQLEDLLRQVDGTWRVTNFGVSATTLLSRGDRPYVQDAAYQRALDSEPDIVIIKLGTNDSKTVNWIHADDYVSDYGRLIDAFRALPSQPEVWICKPVPAFELMWTINPTVIREEILPKIEEIAALKNTPVIDLYTALLDYGHLFPDAIHPDAAGAGIMAQTIAPLLLGVTQSPDFNTDGIVNLMDLAHLGNQWQLASELLDLAPVSAPDGWVSAADLAGLSQTWLAYPGILSHWKFDDMEGNTAADELRDFNGIVHGDPVWHFDSATLNGALELDGVNDYVDLGRILKPQDGPFTLFAWIQGGGPDQVILSQGSSSQNATTMLGTNAHGALLTRVIDGKRTPQYLASDAIITDGSWHSVRLVWNGTIRSLYVDNQEVARDTQEQGNLKASTSPWYLGTSGDKAPGTFWSGLIDDLRIHDLAIPRE